MKVDLLKAKYAEQLIALDDSIQHWVDIYFDPMWHRPYAESCPCCQRWIEDEEGRDCVGCPINEYTEYELCQNTPYQDAWRPWYNVKNSIMYDNAPSREQVNLFHDTCCDEIEFLRTVREAVYNKFHQENSHES